MRMLIPKGKVRATPKTRKFMKDKGREFCLVYFTLAEGDFQGQDVSERFWMHTEKSAKRTVEMLRTCGCSFPNANVTSPEGFGDTDVILVIDHEEGQDGNTYVRVKFVNDLGGGHGSGVGSVDDSTRSEFGAKFAALVGGTPAPDKGPADDSDIPF